jgi:hypothetical protein
MTEKKVAAYRRPPASKPFFKKTVLPAARWER